MHRLGMSRWMRVRELAARVLRFHRTHGSKRLAQEIAKRLQDQLIPHASRTPLAEKDTGAHQGSSIAEPTPFAPSAASVSPAIANPLVSTLRFFSTPRQGHGRITLLTDHAPSEPWPESFRHRLSLVATLAQQRQQRLRIISRQQLLQEPHLVSCMTDPRIDLPHDVEVCYLPIGSFATQIDLFPDELLFTSSWTCTASVISTVNPQNIYYLMHEDERLFCKNENDDASCVRMWSDPRINLVINTPHFLMQLQAQEWCAHAQPVEDVLTKLSAPPFGSRAF
jgi:hypothetical protein